MQLNPRYNCLFPLFIQSVLLIKPEFSKLMNSAHPDRSLRRWDTILREMKYYPTTERNLVLNLVPGNCPEVLIAGRSPTKQTLQELPEDLMKPNTRTESQCISFTEPRHILPVQVHILDSST